MQGLLPPVHRHQLDDLRVSRKLPIRTYLLAIAISVNAVKGLSALQLGRDLDVQAKTAFVLAHKLRESMSADQDRYQPAAVWPPEIQMPPLPARPVTARLHRHYSLKTKVFTEYALSTHRQMNGFKDLAFRAVF